MLATDGSEEAALAEAAAVELAEGTGSELHVVYVVATVPELPYPRTYAKEQGEPLLEQRRLRALWLLEYRVRRIEELGGSVAASHYQEGKPEQAVVRLGEELGAGLIITGGRRRSWWERLLGGAGFSEKVTRQAGCPVLVASERRLRGSAVPR